MPDSASVRPVARPCPPPAHRQARQPARSHRRPDDLRDASRPPRAPRTRPATLLRTRPASASPCASGGRSGRPTRSGSGPPSRRTSTTASAPRSSSSATATSPMRAVGDEHVAEWLQGRPQPRHRAAAARDVQRRRQRARRAGSSTATRSRRPAAAAQARGRRTCSRRRRPTIARLIALADELTPPTFAAYLDVAVPRGDAARRAGRAALDEDRLPGRDDPRRRAVEREDAGSSRPEARHHVRTIALTEPARDRLLDAAARVGVRVHDAARHALHGRRRGR